jgi:hypothetical protein
MPKTKSIIRALERKSKERILQYELKEGSNLENQKLGL